MRGIVFFEGAAAAYAFFGSSARIIRLVRLTEAEAITEGVANLHDLGVPRRILEAGLVIAIVLGRQLGVVRRDAAHPDEDGRAGRGVPVMLTQMQAKAAAGNLRVEGEIVSEAMFPIDSEAKEIHVELLRLLDREDAEDRDCVLELGHSARHGWNPRSAQARRQRRHVARSGPPIDLYDTAIVLIDEWVSASDAGRTDEAVAAQNIPAFTMRKPMCKSSNIRGVSPGWWSTSKTIVFFVRHAPRRDWQSPQCRCDRQGGEEPK